MPDQLLTPSKITAWLDCDHYLELRRQVDDGTLGAPRTAFGSFAQLLADKGLEHEQQCLDAYRAEGRSVLEIPQRDRGESFNAWVKRVGDPFGIGADVIYQMPFVHDGVRGIADFLVRVEDPDPGWAPYEPLDAKLARAEAKPGHVLQLCFYASAIEAVLGGPPGQIHLWLGSGRIESLVAAEFQPYWKRLRLQLANLLDDDSPRETVPEPCTHCMFCEFSELCEADWRSRDSLTYVAGLNQRDLVVLEAAGTLTLADLAATDAPIEGIRPERLDRLVDQAALQVAARAAPESPPPFEVIQPGDDPTWGRGFLQLPSPDDGDIFLDFEGHPFWRADAGLFFLFGWIALDADGAWTYETRWAHSPEEEAAAAESLIEYVVDRRAAHPGTHVYHYNHTERSSLVRLATDHGVGEVALAELVETGCFVDLLVAARNAIQVGTESYGLKHLERLTTYERGHEIDQGSGAVLEYENYVATQEASALERIAAYNEDDVRATMALRDWLVDHRPAQLEWRAARFEPDDGIPELDESVEALHAFGPGTPEHLLGDVLGYWRREWFAHLAPKLALTQADTAVLLDAPDVLAGLANGQLQERTGARGQAITPSMRFDLPAQAMESFRGPGDQVIYSTAEGPVGYAALVSLDAGSRSIELSWNAWSQELGDIPAVVVLNDWVSPTPKPAALHSLAASVIAGSPAHPVSMALLRRDLPVFLTGHGPEEAIFDDDLDAVVEWVRHLDHSFVAIQGPPGTGKTFRGAHIVRSLILAGQRVGITAMSHHAIDNLLEAVVKLFDEHADLDRLTAVKRGPSPASAGLPGVTYASGNPAAAKVAYNLVAGTTWLFAGNDMAAAPVDVLIVDEAGQLALADALAATRSAQNLVLLGDPLQLPQVAQASHPDGSGSSVLEHVLGEDATIPPDRGVFLTETRRLHPDICEFISEEIYEGRLTGHPNCAIQTTAHGTGLRWLRAEHDGASTESIEEAELVAAEIKTLIGTTWTDQEGTSRALTTTDVMVVAPFKDQVHLLREVIDVDPQTRGVPVGTVDKFQGREAAVVFFTMTTSSAADMTRGAEFLFSRNRLNVAISRARCLAYLVCTEELLNSRARTVQEMRLISTLCSFVEHVER